MADRKVFLDAFYALATAFRHEPTEALVALYWRLFGAWSDERWAAAVERAIRTERFFPVPAVFFGVEVAAEAAQDQAEAVRVYGAAIRTWNHAQRNGWVPMTEVRERLGEAAAGAMQAAGGSAVATADDEQEPWVRKAFVEAYCKLARAEHEDAPAALPPKPRPVALPKAEPEKPPEPRPLSPQLAALRRQLTGDR